MMLDGFYFIDNEGEASLQWLEKSGFFRPF
jgi:hypothetical protein